ncbi:hypothetical protein E0Z10_g3378 [Xylaria hypoxylon]|uniref:RING-type domain-containing protein n=1 Tax=Xylaria hypoxylon TaxID=37992 RepID=A0A4Z0ZA30_9PEZI|nr:hypothetical protein E0Z10_g3378 [Xylaria hypoxylon]
MMDWSVPWDDSNHASSPRDSDLSVYRELDSLMEDAKQSDVIVLDGDSPIQMRPEHDEISCKNDVLLVFPDICQNYLTQLVLDNNFKSGEVISAILDKQEKGENYPTQAAPEPRSRKRKRADGSNGPVHDLDHDSDEESEEGDPESVRSIKLQIATREYAANMASPEYAALARLLISQDFPRVPQITIRNLLLGNKMSVFETYTAMDEKLRNWDDANTPWKEKKTLTKTKHEFTSDRLSNLDMSTYKTEERAAFAEFVAARELRAAKNAKIAAGAEEQNNFFQAQIEGQTTDCGICFEECALNRMVQCEGEPMHWFCRNCLRYQAETQIGMAKYELTCMSLDGCSAGFSRAQRALFLDKKLTVALDRIEQEAVLRMAGIENLETCPFCPYAAEYPPVEVDKEFRCDNPHCQQVSCRLCRRETHIPKTCAEADADRGLDARHILEEAMSEALIRRCNQCQNPFVKQDGCNKIRCTKCGTLQCDVCRKTIKDYAHFDDLRRGGRTGHCPLFDASQDRYEKEVSSVEAEIRKKVVNENPDVDEAALHIPVSQKIQQDGDKNKIGIHRLRGYRPVPLPVAFPRPLRQVLADRPRLRLGGHPAHAQPDDLEIQHLNHNMNLLQPVPVMGGAVQPNQVFRQNGRIDLVKAAEDIVQKAMKRMERPMPLRVNRVGSPGVVPMPAPRPRAIDSFMSKVENLKKRNAEARRPNHLVPVNQQLGMPAMPMAQVPVNPFDFDMNFGFQPFEAFPRPLNVPAPLVNQGRVAARRVEQPQRDPVFDQFVIDPDDPVGTY